MIRANTSIVDGELIDGFCVNEVPALVITINIDKIVLHDLIGNDIVPKVNFCKSLIHKCYDVFVIFSPVLCFVFRSWRRVSFFFANDSLQHQYSSWRINRWLLRKQLRGTQRQFSGKYLFGRRFEL